MEHALVIYETMYGNTEVIAHAIGRGISECVRVDVIEVGAAPTTVPASG
jgi:flavorubredoxin